MPGSSGRRQSACLLIFTVLAVFAPISVSAEPLNGLFKGNAWGAIGKGVPAALAKTLHKVAYRPLPCGGTDGATLQKTVTGFSAGPNGTLLRIGSTTSTILTAVTDTTAKMVSTSTVNNVSLFDGLVTVDQIKAVATVDGNAGLVAASSTGSELTGLVIDGQPIADPAAGTQWSLPNIGTLTARRISIDGNPTNSQRIIIDMLVVKVTNPAGAFGMPVNSTLDVGHAQSFFGRQGRPIYVGGQAWVALESNSLLESAGFQAIGCDGTYGKTETNNVGSFRMPGIDIASATTTKFGGPDGAGKTIARTSSTTRGGSILGGRITFNSITAMAEDKFNGSTHVRSAAGTVFSGLKIDGKSIDNPRANLRPLIRVAGYGLVYVNEQIIPAAASRNKMKVNGLRVVIDTVPNALDLPLGTQLYVAHADATADR